MRIDCARRCAGTLLAAALLAGCRDADPPGDPPGAWWAARSGAAHALLDELAQLEGTPLARRAREIAAALPACEGPVGVHAPDGDLARLVDPARCLSDGDPLARALLRAGGEIAFALPTAAHGSLRGVVERDADQLAADLRWTDPPREGALALLVPGDQSAGPDRLASAGRLVHVRARPRAGFDFGSLVPSDSQADQLFRLQSGLFASAVLDGTWEGAGYLPERAGAMPAIALALGFTLRSAAITAVERTISELQQTWPVHRTGLHLRGSDGACLPDLNVLPELAPCYVTTRDTLLVGWNRASLERALVAEAEAAAGDPARLDVDLALIQQADALVAGRVPAAAPALHWPWTRLSASGAQRGDALAVRVVLWARPRAAS